MTDFPEILAFVSRYTYNAYSAILQCKYVQGRGKSDARVQVAPSILRFCSIWHKNTKFSSSLY